MKRDFIQSYISYSKVTWVGRNIFTIYVKDARLIYRKCLHFISSPQLIEIWIFFDISLKKKRNDFLKPMQKLYLRPAMPTSGGRWRPTEFLICFVFVYSLKKNSVIITYFWWSLGTRHQNFSRIRDLICYWFKSQKLYIHSRHESRRKNRLAAR